MRVLGRFWCPRCFLRTDCLLAVDASPEEDEPDLECADCGYVHTKVYTERPGLPAEVRHSIPRDAREAERKRMLSDFAAKIWKAGYPRENLTQPTRRRNRKNHG